MLGSRKSFLLLILIVLSISVALFLFVFLENPVVESNSEPATDESSLASVALNEREPKQWPRLGKWMASQGRQSAQIVLMPSDMPASYKVCRASDLAPKQYVQVKVDQNYTSYLPSGGCIVVRGHDISVDWIAPVNGIGAGVSGAYERLRDFSQFDNDTDPDWVSFYAALGERRLWDQDVSQNHTNVIVLDEEKDYPVRICDHRIVRDSNTLPQKVAVVLGLDLGRVGLSGCVDTFTRRIKAELKGGTDCRRDACFTNLFVAVFRYH
ncbi:hypothetical protein QMT40_002846 [Parvibaculaceae bacterium PLY_AMNH_Bact1]|nr:hypothetical protein QMT40_002846 [Parvibaculaceae bacterium PLY_AMNH_Bact1]